jgi:hypothetical protein
MQRIRRLAARKKGIISIGSEPRTSTRGWRVTGAQAIELVRTAGLSHNRQGTIKRDASTEEEPNGLPEGFFNLISCCNAGGWRCARRAAVDP